jgi:hypothetical protein
MKCSVFAMRIPSTGGRRRLGALQITNDLANLRSIVLVWNSLQSSPVQIDGINRAPGASNLGRATVNVPLPEPRSHYD